MTLHDPRGRIENSTARRRIAEGRGLDHEGAQHSGAKPVAELGRSIAEAARAAGVSTHAIHARLRAVLAELRSARETGAAAPAEQKLDAARSRCGR